ncbi:hypothetical protein KSS87_019694 [Heliosperma pusillum]|nr:hypothetical protein KSS87_019694 [Heliosperma pusillum]
MLYLDWGWQLAWLVLDDLDEDVERKEDKPWRERISNVRRKQVWPAVAGRR